MLLDPGPLAAEIEPAAWAIARARADWITSNEREAAILTGETDVTAAVLALGSGHGSALVRLGADGCLLAQGGAVVRVAGFPTDPVDTNGAGDAHTGAFISGLAAGLDPVGSARRANAAAAIAVSRSGPATAPTTAELEAFLRLDREHDGAASG